MTAAVRTWWLAARPKTLTAAVVPVAVGTALAWATHSQMQGWVVACAIGAALFIQIATNLFNDAIDFAKGADTEARVGPQRVTQSGRLTPRQVLGAGVACCAVAVGLGVPLAIQGGWLVVGIGVASLVCAYAYTGGPLPLAYHGMGDLFVLIFFGVVAVAVTHYLHTGVLHVAGLYAGLQVGALATLLIAINNLRDVHTDREVQKRTLPVRFGERFARAEIAVVALAPFLMNLYWWAHGWIWAALLPLVALPLAVSTVVGVYRSAPGPRFNAFLGRAALVHLVAGLLLSVGLWIG